MMAFSGRPSGRAATPNADHSPWRGLEERCHGGGGAAERELRLVAIRHTSSYDASSNHRPDRPGTRSPCHEVPMSSMPEPLHPVARGLAAPAGSLDSFPPVERWDDWGARRRRLAERSNGASGSIPTICFNCEAACGLLACVDKATGGSKVRGQPVHPGSRGRTAPRARPRSTRSTILSGSSIRFDARARAARASRNEGRWDEALDDIAGRSERAGRGTPEEIMYHVGRPGDD